jgi:hypothetical protein
MVLRMPDRLILLRIPGGLILIDLVNIVKPAPVI